VLLYIRYEINGISGNLPALQEAARFKLEKVLELIASFFLGMKFNYIIWFNQPVNFKKNVIGKIKRTKSNMIIIGFSKICISY
jgi:hypothetical protein